jgi:hypothetical protein
MKIYHWALLFASASPSLALGADADNGRDIAQQQCSPCHIVEPHQRREVAIAPPFDVIGRKSGFDADMLAYALLEPHPKMNFAVAARSNRRRRLHQHAREVGCSISPAP